MAFLSTGDLGPIGQKVKAGAPRVLSRLRDLIWPPECAACRAPVGEAQGLCAACWPSAGLITGPVCSLCGSPVLGGRDDPHALCEGCSDHPPGWDAGCAAMLYDGAARRMLMRLKHADRPDVAIPLARWMGRAGRELIARAEVIVPVPLHPVRLRRRKYNQALELARRLPGRDAARLYPDLLLRTRATPQQKAVTRTARQAQQSGSVAVRRGAERLVAGRAVLVVDDVMTTGATLSACTEALRAAGARQVAVLVAARVTREGFDLVPRRAGSGLPPQDATPP